MERLELITSDVVTNMLGLFESEAELFRVGGRAVKQGLTRIGEMGLVIHAVIEVDVRR